MGLLYQKVQNMMNVYIITCTYAIYENFDTDTIYVNPW